MTHDQTIEECIDKNSLNTSEVINDVFLGWATQRASLLGRGHLVVERLAPFLANRAKQFTINVRERIGPDWSNDQLFIELNANNDKYEVFVHDGSFFSLSWIPGGAFPFVVRTFEKSEKVWFPIILTEVEELNLPQDPCNKDEKYNFQVLAVQKICSAKKYAVQNNIFRRVSAKV